VKLVVTSHLPLTHTTHNTEQVKTLDIYTVFQIKTGPFQFIISLLSQVYELHEYFQKYMGGVACCEYEYVCLVPVLI